MAGRKSSLVFYVGLDHDTFNPQRRRALREEARRQIGLSSERFALILVGNDWHNKGVLGPGRSAIEIARSPD